MAHIQADSAHGWFSRQGIPSSLAAIEIRSDHVIGWRLKSIRAAWLAGLVLLVARRDALWKVPSQSNRLKPNPRFCRRASD